MLANIPIYSSRAASQQLIHILYSAMQEISIGSLLECWSTVSLTVPSIVVSMTITRIRCVGLAYHKQNEITDRYIYYGNVNDVMFNILYDNIAYTYHIMQDIGEN